MRYGIVFALASALLAVLSVACATENELILATTTSTQDSGLLDSLVPLFEEQTGYNVKTIAVGSGQALRLGEEGEADVILAHSPDAEEAFMAGGHGIDRRPVMHNDFVIVGPAADPAGVLGAASVAEAFAAIASDGSGFISRGDNSGTHTRELSLWESADVSPKGRSWYQETGQSMGATLTIASGKQAYTLADRGTYLALRDDVDLAVLYEGDPDLFNSYHVIVVNPAKHASINVEGARAFAGFITSSATQELIRTFGTDRFGQPLFVPDAFLQSTPGSGAGP